MGRLLAFCVIICVLALQVFICVVGARMGSDGRSDFRQFYTAGYMVRSGNAGQIYDYDTEKEIQEQVAGHGSPLPFDHLAYETLLFAPLTFLRFSTAYFVFWGVNLLLLALATCMFKPYLSSLSTFAPWLPYTVFVCFLPAALTLVQGQDSIVLLVLMIAAFKFIERGRDLEAGILIGLGLFKFQYVIPIVVLFLLWRRWRVVIGAAISGVTLALASVWITGWSATAAFARTLLVMGTGLSSQAERMKFGTFPERMPNLRGLIYGIARPLPVTSSHVVIAVALCSLLVILLAALMRPSFPLAITAATLVSYHCLMHDTILLIIPILMALDYSVAQGKKGAIAVIAGIFVGLPIVFPFMDGRYSLLALPVMGLMWIEASKRWQSATLVEAHGE